MRFHHFLMSNMIKNHPSSLKFLFYTELWERFSFYGMKSLLILYMHDMFAKQKLNHFLGHDDIVSFLQWVNPSNNPKAILLGCLLMSLGHLSFFLDYLFYFSLFFIALGSGLFKSNLSVQIGQLYHEKVREKVRTHF